MKNKLLTLAGTLATLAVLGHFYAKPLLAQVRAALVQDRDQPARQPFAATFPLRFGVFDDVFFLDKQTTGTLSNVVPAGKRLVITHVWGTVFGSGDARGDLMGFVSVGGSGALAYGTITFPARVYPDQRDPDILYIGTVSFYQAVDITMNPGDTIEIGSLTQRGGGGGNVGISGYLIDIP